MRRLLTSVTASLVASLLVAAAPAGAHTTTTTTTTSTTSRPSTTTTTRPTTTSTSTTSTTSTTATTSGSTTSTSGVEKSQTSTTSTTRPRPKPTGTENQVVDMTFPADRRVTYTNDYKAGRSGGRVHKSTDLFGPKLWKLYAARDGRICFITGIEKPMPAYGYMIELCGDDGRTYTYIHLNNDTPGTDDGQGGPEWAYAKGIREDVRVKRGQFLGYLGDSGNAEGTPPHLHFEIDDPDVIDPWGTHHINPYFSLKEAQARGDYAPEANEVPNDPVDRIAGADRIATAIAISQAAFPTSTQAVVTTAVTVADALVAAPLAGALDAPVLLSGESALDDRVKAELKRLGATSVTVVGGALSPQIEADLANAGITKVKRLAGADRYETAVQVATAIWGTTPIASRVALVALGNHKDPARMWPDALTAGYLGAVTETPVLLVGLTGATEDTVRATEGIAQTIVVGGTAAVPQAVADHVSQGVAKTSRLAGPDRYATGAAVLEHLGAKVDRSRVWAATGRLPYDALAAAGAVAQAGDAMVLIDGLDAGADTATGRWLVSAASATKRGTVLGGVKVVTPAAADRFGRRIT